MKKMTVIIFTLYSVALFSLLVINFQNQPVAKATVLMGFMLLVLWVGVGGLLQIRYRTFNYEVLTQRKDFPVLSFVAIATLLGCIEEALATLITNFAPLFGVQRGEAYITASANYGNVIFFHSVIVFIPMFIMLGYLLKKYSISPFAAFLLFGIVGVFAEFTLSGKAVFINAPFWILVYGLMVYLPAHRFITMKRKTPHVLLYLLFVPLIAFSAVATFWIPALFSGR